MAEQETPPQRSLASSAGMLILAGALATGLQFAVGVALARALTKGDFGTYKQVYLLFGIVTPLFSLALPGSLLYFIPRAAKAERARIVSQTLWVLTGFGAILGGFFWVTAPFWAERFSNPELITALRIFAFVPATALPASALPNVAVAFGRARMAAVSSLLLNTANLALVAGAALVTQDLEAVLVLTVVSSAVQAVASFWLSGSAAGGLVLSVQWRSLRDQFSYAIPLALSGLVGLLAYQTDRLLVSLRFAPAEFAIYAIGAVEVPLIATVNSSVNSVLMPRISELHSEGDSQGIVTLYREAVRKTAVVTLPFFGYLMFLAFEFITFLYPGYAASVSIFRVYLLLLPLRVATYGLILQATGETPALLRGSAYYLIGNAAVCYALMFVLGLSGPAWGTVLATVLIAVWYLLRSARSIGVSAVSLMPWRAIAVLTGVSLMSGLAAVGFARLLVTPAITRLILGAAVMFVSYIGLGRLTGALTNADVARLRSWLTKYIRRPVSSDR